MVSFSLLDPQNQRNVTKYWWFKTEAVIQIGRSPDNQVFIDNNLVSWQHLELQRVNHSGTVAWQIVNGGTNPTFVNNVLLPKGNSSLLADGDLIQIGKSGDVLLKFQLRCTHAGTPQGNNFCIHCGEQLSKLQQATMLEGQTGTQLEAENDYDRLLDELESNLRVEEEDFVKQLYQNLSNQGDTRRAARAKRLLEEIEQLKRQTPPVINPPAPPPPPPRSELEKVELVETKTNAHSGSVVAVAISPDCQTLVSCSYNNINIWNLNTGAIINEVNINYYYFEISDVYIKNDGQNLVIIINNNYWILDLRTGHKLFEINRFDNQDYYPKICKFFAISHDRKIAGIENKRTQEENELSASAQKAKPYSEEVINATKQELFKSQEIFIWHLDSGELLSSVAGHSRGNVTSAAFSPDGKTLVSGDDNGIIKIWRLGTVELPRILMTGHSKAITFLAISPDGQNIVSCSAENTINIWNFDTGELLHTLTGNAKVIAISPDSQTLVSGSGKEIKIWEMGTRQLLNTLSSYSPEVTSVAISSDGQMLVTGGSDGTIQIWRVR